MRWSRVYLIGVLLVAAALRFYGLGDKSLWGDEIAQALWSSWEPVVLWQQFRTPPDFVSHFALVHLVQWIGTSEFWIRFPSAVTSMLAVPLTYVVVRRLTDRTVALVATTLVAVAPYQIWYAQEARMYAALGCYALLGLYFFLRLLDLRGGETTAQKIWLAVGLIVGNTLAVFTHLFGVFPVFSQVVIAGGILVVGWLRTRRTWFPTWARWFAGGLVVIGLLALPLAPGTLPYVMQGGKPAVAETIAPTPPFQLTAAFVWELVGDFGLGAQEPWRTWVVLGGALVGLVMMILARPRSTWIVGVWLLLPLATLAVTQPKHGVAGRYLVFFQPMYLMLLAYAGVAVCRSVLGFIVRRGGLARNARIFRYGFLIGGAILLAWAVVPPLTALYPRAKLNDWRAIAEYVESNAHPGDLVFGERNTPNMNALTYYLPNLLRYDTPPTSIERMEDAIAAKRRIWYISVGEFFDPEGEAWVREHLERVPDEEWQEPGLDYVPQDDFRFTQSEHLAVLYKHGGTTPVEIVYRGRQGFSNENTEQLRLNPGETVEMTLEAGVGVGKMLTIELSSKKPAQFEVALDGEPLAVVREEGAEKGGRVLRFALPADGEILVGITNQNTEFPMFIRKVGIE